MTVILVSDANFEPEGESHVMGFQAAGCWEKGKANEYISKGKKRMTKS
jgi:hypothetical protein